MTRGSYARVALLSLAGVSACGGAQAPPETEVVVQGRRPDEAARCEFAGRTDREVTESRAPGALAANVRRIYGYIGQGEDRRRILLCREVDTNFDGVKDIVRTYGEQGQRLTEEADTDYDGKIDTWITFGKTKPAQVEVDADGDGKVEEIRFYSAGVISRVQRDTNGDNKPDIFEVYREGTLDRMGIDANFDGQVDRWDRDEVRARAEAEKSAAEERAAEAARAASETEAN